MKFSNRLKKVLGIEDSPHDGISVQSKKGLIELDKEDPPKEPPVQTQENGSFKEDFIKHFGEERFNELKLKQDKQKEDILRKREENNPL